MKLVKPSYEIFTVDDKPITRRKGHQVLRYLEKIARTCYKSEDKIGRGTAAKLVKGLIARGHEAMLEFYDVVVKFTVDRGVTHELVRHRIASYAQESTRYCNYGKQGEVVFILPPWVKVQPGSYTSITQAPHKLLDNPTCEWFECMLCCEHTYLKLIKLGWSPQQARSVLPNSLKTEIVSKFNIREWRHIFRLRTATAAHPQMREIMQPLLSQFREVFPVLFDDVGQL